MDLEHRTQEEEPRTQGQEPRTQGQDQPEHVPPQHGRSRPPYALPPSPVSPPHCQECSKNSALFAQFLLSPLTYVLLSYFVRLHCANVHTPLCFFYP